MDKETRFAFASVYEDIDRLVSEASDARASALAIESALAEAIPGWKKLYEKHYHLGPATEIRLQAEHVHTSIRQVIERLQTLKT